MKMGVITEIEDENGRKPLKMGLKQNKDLKIKRKKLWHDYITCESFINIL